MTVSEKLFYQKQKKTKTMSDKTDYEALEKSVKYISWKGKKAEWYKWQDIFGSGNEMWISWRTSRIGGNTN